MKKFILFTAIFVISIAQGIAQVGINADNTAPAARCEQANS